MIYRNATDLAIWNEVYLDNIYQLPDDMTGWGMIDIGAHIGSATVRALDCGAEYVVAIEPLLSNFNILKANTNIYKKLSMCTCWNLAAKGELCDSGPIKLSILNENQEGNISTVWWESGGTVVSATTLFWFLQELHGRWERVALKIDCEGAEYDILMHSDLSKISMIVGEVHEVPAEVWRDGIKRTKEKLFSHLTRVGFNVSITKQIDEQLTIFKAER